MAHFAQLDENNQVIQVIVVDNGFLLDENGEEKEELGVEFCKKLLGENTRWVQTSYNSKFRKRFAGTGAYYDPVKDVFIENKLYPSWVYDDEEDMWVAPIPKPDDTPEYGWIWDEEIKNWKPFYTGTGQQ